MTARSADIPLGRSTVRVGRLGLGAAPLGNLFNAVSDATAVAIVDTAWTAGVRYFDTAPHYGPGLAERRLGAALAGRPRTDYVLSTKIGRRLVPESGRCQPPGRPGIRRARRPAPVVGLQRRRGTPKPDRQP